jgi:hypothetical protein
MYYEVKDKTNKLLEKRMSKTDKENIKKISSFNKTNNMLEPMLNMTDLDAMLTDTDLLVLQNNYQYIMWSIVAVGLISVTINTIKR